MADKDIIAVVGATGMQGGGRIRADRQRQGWRVCGAGADAQGGLGQGQRAGATGSTGGRCRSR